MSFQLTLKVVLAGEPAVGKTSIVRRWTQKTFRDDYLPTIGVDIYTFSSIHDTAIGRVRVLWQIWDLAGHPEFSSVDEAFFENARGVFLVYDVSRPDTLVAIPNWFNRAVKRAHPTAVYVLVGNKVDLRETQPCVTEEQGREMAQRLAKALGREVMYVETSAKTGFNIRSLFDEFVKTFVRSIISRR